jgi:DNA-binding NarL/FixJ family response regulator
MKPLRVLLADDHDVVRAGTRLMIEARPGWEVCGEASDGREAVEMAGKLKPDVVVLDMTMPKMSGLDAARQIRRRSPGTELLMFTAHESEDIIRQVFEAGVRSYILKTEATTQLVPALTALAMHKPFFTTNVSEVLFARYMQSGSGHEPTNGRLTTRERETVHLLADGKSNKEVADVLGISVKTVETHRAAIMRKLRLKSFAELVRYAVRNGIIEA